MLYLDRIVVHNFKSFKHANIKFGKGFNCIAGPNGSGKSNICDSLLFALGEQSLKRLRISSTAQLVSENKGRSDYPHTYVKAVFDGDRAIEVLREIRGDRIIYRLDGKAVARQDIIDVLRENRCEINETNTITQGETAKLLDLNPRERRELIDVAAGIKEFEAKKDNAIKELDKVEDKINNVNILLKERIGFLEELAKEKEQAERYNALTTRIRSINYTLLKSRETSLSEEYMKKNESLQKNNSEKADAEKKIVKMDSELMALSLEKESLSKKLNEKSIDANNNNRLIERFNKEIAINESKIGALNYNKDSLSERKTSISAEMKKIKAKLEDNKKIMAETRKELKGKESAIPKGDELAKLDMSERISSEYREMQKKIEIETEKFENLDRDYAKILFDFNSIEKEINEANQNFASVAYSAEQKKNAIKHTEEEFGIAEKAKSELLTEIQKLEAERHELQKKQEALQVESINLREQAAITQSNSMDKTDRFLKANLKSGFYGKAGDLCTYDDKYAKAIGVAAGARMNYFVVDSIEIADKAIKLIKENNMGRATFIPLNDIKIGKYDSLGLEKLISFVKYDKKFDDAFSYIFSNTYLIDDIKNAKKYGIGKGRYVTLEGELVEQSGIVSGGTSRPMQSAANIEAKTRKLNSEVNAINTQITSNESSMTELKRKLSSTESTLARLGVELKYAKDEISKFEKEANQLSSKVSEKNEKRLNLDSLMKKIVGEKESCANDLKAHKDAGLKLYSELTTLIIESGSNNSNGMSESYKKIRQEIEDLKVKIAEANTENSLMEERYGQLTTELRKIDEDIERLNNDEKKTHAEVETLNKELSELNEKVKNYDDATKEVYSAINSLDAKMNSISSEKGKLSGFVERVNRDIFEIETLKAQLEVRIGDIRAELSTYSNVEEIKDIDAKHLEGELLNKRAEMESIGAVNLKAPEIYASKKKDVEEVQKQMETLDNEKSSVLEMINEIESKKHDIFFSTFDKVSKNFKQLAGSVFDNVELKLDNNKDPFESGLVINVTIDKKQKRFESLSGGQKLLTMLMLIFSIQRMKPMAFYLFDEIDAALDKENSKKLSILIKELSKNSQFIVVTHNDSLITGSDVSIGVAMHNHESRAVGIMLTDTNK